MKKRFGKNDMILIGILLAAGLLVFFGGTGFYHRDGGKIQVQVDGKIYGTYSLKEEQTIPIKNGERTTNILQIEKGEAFMLTADCPDQLCVHQQAVSGKGQTIVCLPNKVVAEVLSAQEQDYDAIAK